MVAFNVKSLLVDIIGSFQWLCSFSPQKHGIDD
jgi:hypothetical protein